MRPVPKETRQSFQTGASLENGKEGRLFAAFLEKFELASPPAGEVENDAFFQIGRFDGIAELFGSLHRLQIDLSNNVAGADPLRLGSASSLDLRNDHSLGFFDAILIGKFPGQ